MFALALKDFSLMGKRFWLIGGVAFLFLIYPGNPAFGLAISLLPALYVTAWACGSDFQSKADSFIACLPVAPGRVVGARFAVVPVAWAAGFASALLIWALRTAFGPFLPAAALPGIAALSLAAALVASAVYLCAYYLFGFQNARWANFLVFGTIGALGPVLGSVLGKGGGGASVESSSVRAGIAAFVSGGAGPGLYLAVLGAAMGLYAVAYCVSFAAYRSRDY
ncbi:MAG: ABC-2 transporter permease [Spirochaetaceae bacterium]|nr:ABC-2 transporter permease [Spirochaetaceae bacterium]